MDQKIKVNLNNNLKYTDLIDSNKSNSNNRKNDDIANIGTVNLESTGEDKLEYFTE